MAKPNEINQLVDRAAEISDHIKNLESQLEPLKKKIEVHVRENCTDKEILAGITIKGKVGSVEIIGGEKRADANPKKTLDYMEKQGLAGKFFDVVKVQAGKLSALIGVDACNRLRPVTGVSISQSFKVEGK